MTRPPNDPPRLWLKMVPNNRITDDGVWTRVLLKGHHTVRRASVPDQGDKATCECGFTGRFDASASPRALYSDAVWRDGGTYRIECCECYLK